MSFETLGLSPTLVSAVTRAGYTSATPVQTQAIPAALSGADLMVSSATGSGKTAAFMLPALQRLQSDPRARSIGPRVLVLCPTRELAQQVAKAGQTYGRGLRRLSIVSVVGGMPYPAQLRLLRQPVDVLVATPGRLLDYIGSGRIDFSRCEMLVFDEADRMLDMGFQEDIEQIVATLPKEVQTLMFSATFGGEVGRLAASMLKQPQRIELANQTDRHSDIEQRVHWADDQAHKNRLLDHLLRNEGLTQAIIFAATKRDAEWLSETLADKGFATASLHGDMPQGKRNRTLTGLRRGDIKILVATDVAARGIDVPTISHVINYGMPMKPEDYVHRIGRTGRAGRSGIAITLATAAERSKLRAIERFTTQKIPASEIAGLEPRAKPEHRGTERPRGFSDRPRSFSDRPRSNAERRMGAGRKPAKAGEGESRSAFRQEDRTRRRAP
ncbi:MAG: RNA helicase [Candidatus Dactylopiibacterium carminicum]|uniref:ATP-dependent helicase n=1 Tax=Candidatus Dactylopiibacterium carminicum TaxID=857335 RepID=A0A272EMF4_9RHOO|nr:DEAD/DEAH box helicase [Candidatus Dactylopiibacterium carminicum]KAF7597698.1 ATP-dependent helicase [Candidatus Dactylopiibacterium carminicum]PAS91308.1 MAG: RNA helicase [Candidatus Dactylopiibacterium carminicum]PAS92038.1 MAG: RNA helicase [Candidatus Dactylopiibacterium carminicum]PAS94350.1 MAG: RNA helicase [Candidatus Dactylopiibacterium carminicum]